MGLNRGENPVPEETLGAVGDVKAKELPISRFASKAPPNNLLLGTTIVIF